MTMVDGLGFVAAGLVLATFCMKQLVPLRGMAISSNLVFILYGYAAGIEPVLVLHLILMPINFFRLLDTLRGSTPPLQAPQGAPSAHGGKVQAGSKFTLSLRTIRRQSSPCRGIGA